MSGTTYNFDGGKKARMTRKSVTMKHDPKDRTKAKRDPKAKYKKRRKK